METVEMDLMQAQIGSLATDVSRLEAKVAKGGGVTVQLSNFTPNGESAFWCDSSILASEIAEYIKKGIPVSVILDLRPVGVDKGYIIPIQSIIYEDNEVKYVSGKHLEFTGAAIESVWGVQIQASRQSSPVEHDASVWVDIS